MNGGLVRRQIKGIACAPQLATLSFYPIKKKYVLETKPTAVIIRFIDDFWTCDMSPPPASDYGMEHKKTSENPKQAVYLGIKIDVRGGRVHTTVFDQGRAVSHAHCALPALGYRCPPPPKAIWRGSNGAFIACQKACTHMQDFKESVGNVVRRAGISPSTSSCRCGNASCTSTGRPATFE